MAKSLKRRSDEPLDLSISKRRPVEDLNGTCFWCQEATTSSCTECIVKLPCCLERVHRPCAELAFGKARYDTCKLCTGVLPKEFLKPYLDHFKPFGKESIASQASTVPNERTRRWVLGQRTPSPATSPPSPQLEERSILEIYLRTQQVITEVRRLEVESAERDALFRLAFPAEEEEIQILAVIPPRH